MKKSYSKKWIDDVTDSDFGLNTTQILDEKV